jgi:hypothetical protein
MITCPRGHERRVSPCNVSEAVGELPLRFPAFLKPKRKPRLKRFPYALVFIELTEEVRVVAFAHMKRRPL